MPVHGHFSNLQSLLPYILAVAIIMNVMTKDFTILEIVQLFKLVIFCVLCVLKASIQFFFSP